MHRFISQSKECTPIFFQAIAQALLLGSLMIFAGIAMTSRIDPGFLFAEVKEAPPVTSAAISIAPATTAVTRKSIPNHFITRTVLLCRSKKLLISHKMNELINKILVQCLLQEPLRHRRVSVLLVSPYPFMEMY